MDLTPELDVFDKTKIPVWEQGQHGGHTRPINQDVLFNNFCEIVELFKKHNIDYAISHGTLLGLVRLGTLIPWDDDMDITLFTKDHSKFPALEEELRNRGYHVPIRTDRPADEVNPLEKMYWYDFVAIKDGEKIEGWFVDKVRDNYVYDKPRIGLAWPEKFFNTLSSVSWRDEVFNAPAFTEEYLERMYGNFPINEENAHRKYIHKNEGEQ